MRSATSRRITEEEIQRGTTAAGLHSDAQCAPKDSTRAETYDGNRPKQAGDTNDSQGD